jgi:hypothetical protein
MVGIAERYAGSWNADAAEEAATMTKICQYTRLSEKYSIARVSDPRPATLSAANMTTRRLTRSTITPAVGARTIPGRFTAKSMSPSRVTEPVSWYTQMVMANPVIAVPTCDTNCPTHTVQNVRMDCTLID